MTDRSVWVGWEPREAAAYAVAVNSCRRLSEGAPIHGIILSRLREFGLYRRPHSMKGHQPWDDISDAPMSTEFSCSRFLVPHLANLAGYTGWALFVDCDMLFRRDVNELFDACDDDKAVMVVKHKHKPSETTKMDGVMQTRYARKNWSSVCAFNLAHPANERLTLDLCNTQPGRNLHGFCWLRDHDIGELSPDWNYLVGHSDPAIDPAIVHHTDGIPLMAGYEQAEYADEWRAELDRWAATA